MKIESNVDALIARLQKRKNALENRMHLFLERLSEIGIEVAGIRFREAQYDGDNDVVVNESPEWIDDRTLVISATGKAVTFIEFGTGVHYTEQHPKADQVGAIRGAYGQGKGSQQAWGYYGNPGTNGKVLKTTERGQLVLTHGNPPARAMYDAAKEMREQIGSIAKEVFGSD